MRLDKFLKVSRLIKRRTVAKEVCDGGKVSVNGRSAKAGTEVKVGDILELGFGSRMLKVEILAIADTVRADQARDLYKVLQDVKITQEWF
ncbi:RNA-binding S4 domain-containing protein [Dehalobacterium formicoaceticum]|uniref:RQC P-site tRNA stabilizing factor n=1 Tax=Dehalobacterium formicoaceticum TaxID=51515 RepID=A0ABT1Y391_9FIRM|nr:RNA-binding S4 domain-containing protein [Dehalobacterium formicoaceticum]MCR6545337.1 RNA-binding S4 domain-containing protein [Dehalobacterium formicoaceticum]